LKKNSSNSENIYDSPENIHEQINNKSIPFQRIKLTAMKTFGKVDYVSLNHEQLQKNSKVIISHLM